MDEDTQYSKLFYQFTKLLDQLTLGCFQNDPIVMKSVT